MKISHVSILLVLALLLAALMGCAPDLEQKNPQGKQTQGDAALPVISGMGVIVETAPPPEESSSSQEEAPSEEPPAASESSSSPASSSSVASSQPPASSAPPASSSIPPTSSSTPPVASSLPPSSSSSGSAPPASSSSRPPASTSQKEDPVEEPAPPSGGSGETLKVTAGGRTVTGDAADLVAQIVANELGNNFPDEAVKAQAVAAYTYIKFYNNSGTSPSVILGTPTARVKNLVNSVIGQTVRYNGRICLAVYCAYNSGNTASSQNVWGQAYDYLQSVYSDYDVSYNNGGATKKIAASTLKSQLERSLPVSLDGVEKDSWFEILSWHDQDYVKELRIGGQVKITGRQLRESILGGTTLRSTAFEVSYDSAGDQFVFVTQGYGHGVGLSQRGAQLMAQDGWDYIGILEHYYPGAQVV